MIDQQVLIDWDEISKQMSSKAVGRRIYKIRSGNGMSMEYLAGKIDKSRSTVSRIERGTQELTLEQLFSIAETLNVSHFDLLSD